MRKLGRPLEINCTKCKVNPRGQSKGSWCKSCTNEYAKQLYHKSDKTVHRDRWLKRTHGITYDEFKTKLENQNHKCSICFKAIGERQSRQHMKNVACVDHNHTTGKIRDLLCNECNWALGLVEENTDVLNNMIKYVERHGQ